MSIDFRKFERTAAPQSSAALPEDRWDTILGLMQFASNVMRTSPDADRIRRFKESQESEWQRVQRRLFANVPRI